MLKLNLIIIFMIVYKNANPYLALYIGITGLTIYCRQAL